MKKIWILIQLWLVPQLLAAAPLEQAQPWLGIEVDAQAIDGVVAKRILPKTPSDRAGLKSGDLVKAIDDSPVKSRDELLSVLRGKGVGTTVTIHLIRGGKTLRVPLKLELLPDSLELVNRQLMDKPAPEFELTLLDSKKTLRNADFKGKVLILEFWATWCPACRAAMPLVNTWAKAHKNIGFVSISDEDADKVSAFFAKEKPAQTLALDPDGKTQGLYFMNSIPSFILIDKTGTVRKIAIGVGDYLRDLLREAEALDNAKK